VGIVAGGAATTVVAALDVEGNGEEDGAAAVPAVDADKAFVPAARVVVAPPSNTTSFARVHAARSRRAAAMLGPTRER